MFGFGSYRLEAYFFVTFANRKQLSSNHKSLTTNHI